ncbi:hypothetical protein [Actinoallomurus sp. CA-150999]|uniref:hypothetical protein n=1 Tax=Actinoallomurus sp. CA-150999 TaxID=3239887 RepID=UPI003D8BB7EE
MAEHTEAAAAYVACLRRIWVTHGSPSVDQIARRTHRLSFPLSWSEVGAYLRGDVLPEQSLMLHDLLCGITGSHGWRPDDEDQPRVFDLWAKAVGAPDPAPTEPLPVVSEPTVPETEDADYAPATPAPDVVELTVRVASYLAAAGIGGIIGNRADSVVARTTSRLFQSVRDRWRSRGAGAGESLSEEEAIDAAIAGAITLDYSLETLRVTGTSQRSDGSWRVTLAAQDAVLRAVVPAGDPADATILIIPG